MKKQILLCSFLCASLFAAQIKFNEAPANFKRVAPENSSAVLSYYSSIKDAKKAVVNISTTKTLQSSPQGVFDGNMLDPFWDFWQHFRGPRGGKQRSSSLGSGVVISSDGYIVTNNHVVEGADEINVSLEGGSIEYKAKLVGADSKTDLAVIKIEAKNLPAIQIADSSKLLEGDIVFAIGNPFGVGESVTQGIISALNKDNIGINQYENFIQTDASINPGNSGGALVDSRGALVGINTAILSRSGDNNGIGFAIPSNMVKDIASRLISDGKIERGYIGVMIGNLNAKQKEIYENKEGALITGVEAGMPAELAGLKRGDLIIGVDDKAIKNLTDLKNIIGAKKPNDSVKIEFERSGKVHKVTLKLANQSLDMDSRGGAPSAIDGLNIITLNDEVRAMYRIKKGISGVLVTSIAPKSKAESLGFEAGDIIMQVGEMIVEDAEGFNRLIRNSKKTLVWVVRKGQIESIPVK